MRLIIRSLYGLVVALFVISCATQKKTSTASTNGTKYTEDLSVWRPKPESVAPTKDKPVENDLKKQTTNVEAKYTVNKKLDAVLDSIDRINVRRNFVDGYTIQVYTGLKREEALNTKKMITASLPDLESEINYAQPNFRVRVGKYLNRIEAQKDYVAVKKYFPTAIVIPDKIAIN